MSQVVYRQSIGNDRDLVQARSRAMAIAAELGFATREQTQIATALSEIGRNALTRHQHCSFSVLLNYGGLACNSLGNKLLRSCLQCSNVYSAHAEKSNTNR